MKRIAIILCGSGFKDGSEIHESVLTLLALSTRGARYHCFALDRPQHHVVDCLTGKVAHAESRNQLVESARIARGAVSPLTDLSISDFDAVILPGGFGAAKNLCDYAFAGSDAKVVPEVGQVLDGFHHAKKPIGAICIAPMILALHFKGKGLRLTLGPADDEVFGHVRMLGHIPVEHKVDGICIDEANRVVTTPAYMHEAPALHEVARGIDALVETVLKMA